MSAIEIIEQVTNLGVDLRVKDNHLLASPASRLTDDLRASIRCHKKDLLRLLSGQTIKLSDKENLENIREHLEERAAIMEYDGELSRTEAERQAKTNLRVYKYRIADVPNWLTMIAPGCNLGEAEASLRGRFGDRFLEIRRHIVDIDALLKKPGS